LASAVRPRSKAAFVSTQCETPGVSGSRHEFFPGASEAFSASEDARRRLRWLRDHPGPVGSGLLLLFVIVKLLSTARGDAVTAYAILDELSLTTVLVGAVSSICPAIVAFIFFQSARWSLMTMNNRDWMPVVVFVVLIPIALRVASAVMLAGFIAAYLLGYAVAYLVRRVQRRAEVPSAPQQQPVILPTMLILMFSFAVFALISDTVWLPSERIELRGQSQPVVGYVLSTDDPFLTMLHERSREVQRYRTLDIEERNICRVRRDWFSTSVLGFAEKRPRYPSCFPGRHGRAKS
jgi:hypothetical protein